MDEQHGITPIDAAIDSLAAAQNGTAPPAPEPPPEPERSAAIQAAEKILEPPKILSVEDILSAPDLEEMIVAVPEWGGSVKIRSFSKQRQLQMRKDSMNGNEVDSERMELLMFIEGVVEPKFTTAHIDALRQKSAVAMDRVLQAILKLGGLTPDEQGEIEKSFRDGPGAEV